MDVRKLLMNWFQQQDELQRVCEVSLLIMSLLCACYCGCREKDVIGNLGPGDGRTGPADWPAGAGADSLWLVGSAGDLIRCGGF
jgi:hypothetical protein